jgi:Cys-rich protein (TIGR01571 family)
MPEGETIMACAACDDGWDAKLCGCCDGSNGGPMGFITKYFCGMCAMGKLMAATGEGDDGPKAVDDPQNCFLCTLCGAYCACCNRGKYRDFNKIEGTPVNDFLAVYCSPGICQMLNDYERKNNGKFGFGLGAFTKNEAGSPAAVEMAM